MEDTVGIIFATIVAVLLMFLFPLMDTWERQDDLSYMTSYALVVDFVDSVRNTGILSRDMLDDLKYQLNATGNTFDVQLEHRAATYVPNGAGDISRVYVYTYTSQIEKALNTNADGRYVFSKGDYFYASVKNTNKTQSTLIKDFLYSTTLQTFKIGVPYGGLIRNEVIYD